MQLLSADPMIHARHGRQSAPGEHYERLRRRSSPAELLAVLAPLSLSACQSIIGIDPHEFGSVGQSSGGIGDAGQSPGSAGWSNGGEDANDGPNAGGGDDGPNTHAGAGGGVGGQADGGAPATVGTAGSAESEGGARGGEGSTSVDDEPPRILGAFPEHGSRGIDVSEPIVIWFSEPMDTQNVEWAYAQSREVLEERRAEPKFSWNEDHSRLTVLTDLERPRSLWVDADRSGNDAELSVTYRIAARARDPALNALGSDYTATFYLRRRVEHHLSPCLELSGYAALTGFQPAAPSTSVPCVPPSSDPIVRLWAGDLGDRVVAALLSYPLDRLANPLEFQSANLAFVFDDPVGTPHELHKTLFLEHVDPGTNLDASFDAAAISSLGVLARPDADYPLTPIKDVSSAVAWALAGREPSEFVRFRASFERPDLEANQSPDYVRLVTPSGAPPTLSVIYDCDVCP